MKMQWYVVAGMVCVLGAVAVTFCALGMYFQSRKKTELPTVISALKEPDTAKAIGHAAVSDAQVAAALKEALQERDAVVARNERASVDGRASRSTEAENVVRKRHRALLDDALLSLAKGEFEDVQLSLDLAHSFGVQDPESRALEMKIESALHDIQARKKAAAQNLQAQQKPAEAPKAKKKDAGAGDVNPFE